MRRRTREGLLERERFELSGKSGGGVLSYEVWGDLEKGKPIVTRYNLAYINPADTNVSRIRVRTGTVEGFFERARSAARKADRGEAFSRTITLSFEDPKQMFSVLSAGRQALVRAVMVKPRTVAELTRALRRDRTAITKDIKVLEAAGLVQTRRTPNPGHGVMTLVRASAQRIDVVATLAA